jgi:hypothetical protein
MVDRLWQLGELFRIGEIYLSVEFHVLGRYLLRRSDPCQRVGPEGLIAIWYILGEIPEKPYSAFSDIDPMVFKTFSASEIQDPRIH